MTSFPLLTPIAIDPAPFPSGQRVGGWNMDGYTLACALRHMPATGSVLTAGGGSTGFYAVEFAQRGYMAVVMEPVPQDALLDAIRDYAAVRLWRCALATKSGEVAFHINEHRDLSGMATDHWGMQHEHATMTVPAMSYAGALDRIEYELYCDVDALACVQLDIEGSEPDILPSLTLAPPDVLVYEFGGGGTKAQGEWNWSPAHLAKASAAFDAVRGCYERLYIIDAAQTTVWACAVSDVPVGGYVALFDDAATFGNVVLA